MPTQLTIPQAAQFGAQSFEVVNSIYGLLAVRFAWASTFGPMGETLDAAFTPIAGGGIGIKPPTGGESIDVYTPVTKGMLSNTGKALTNTQPAASAHLIQQAFVNDGFATVLQKNAAALLAVKKHVNRKTAPRETIKVVNHYQRANLKPLQAKAETLTKQATQAAADNKALKARVAKLEKQQRKPHGEVWPNPWPRIGDLERLGGWLKGEVERNKKLLGIGAFLILLAKALEKMGANYVRCNKLKRFGPQICGIDDKIFAAILTGAQFIFSVLSIVVFAETLLAVEDRIVGGLQAGLKELKGVKPLVFEGYSGPLTDGK